MSKANLIDFLMAGLVDESGNALSAGTVGFYSTGTTNLKEVYSDAGATAAQTNPVTLDGRGVASVYGIGNYKIVIKDSDGNIQYTITSFSATPSDFIPETETATSDGQLVYNYGTEFGNYDRVLILHNGVKLKDGTFTLAAGGSGSVLTLNSSYESYVATGDEFEAVEI